MAKASENTGNASDQRQGVNPRLSWLLWAGLLGLVILMGSAFSRAWQTNRALRMEMATLEPMITAAQLEQNALRTRLAYVQSDEYVEAWSRSRAKMALPGEVLVVSIDVTPTPTQMLVVPTTPTPTPVPTEEPFWSSVWRWFTGE